MEKVDYIRMFASDFLVVTRNGKVVRVMCNAPGASAVFLELGSKDGKVQPSINYYDFSETGWDPFEIEAYVEEYFQKTGKTPDWTKDLEAVQKGIEEALRNDEEIEEVVVDKEGNVSTKGKEEKGESN